MKANLNERIALATFDGKKPSGNTDGDSGGGSDGRRSQQAHYKVKPFRLEYKGETLQKDGRTYHWCKGEHWHDGKAVNGMYSFHKTEEHDAWRKELDSAKTKNGHSQGGGTSNAGAAGNTTDGKPTPKPQEESKKLALSDKLRAVLTTHTGLSADAYNRIYEEACRDSGNA